MTKVYCADQSCKFNDYGVCKSKSIALAYLYRGSLPGEQEDKEFNKCRTYEPSEFYVKMKKYMEELRNGHPVSED